MRVVRKLLLCLCLVAFLTLVSESSAMVVNATSETEEEQPFDYSVNEDGTTITITGYKLEPSGDLIIPEMIDGYVVTSIGNYALHSSSGFTGNLVIPDSVTSIGDSVFYGCSGFTGNLVIPDSVTSIGYKAFYGCSGFTGNLVIPDSVTYIGGHVFYGCSGFTGNLVIPDGVTSIGSRVFYGCSGFTGNLVIPDSVTYIGSDAFYNCKGLTGDLVIPDSVTYIGSAAFYNCSGFTGNLVISDSVTCISGNTFHGCSGFTGNLVIPDSVTRIGSAAFCNCSGFTGNLVISDSVTYIGICALADCFSIEKFIVLNPNCSLEISDSIFTEGSIVKGYVNSTAYDYAIEYGFQFECIDHDWDDNVTIDVEATCTSAGKQSIHCKYCKVVKDETIIKMLEHDFGEVSIENKTDAKCFQDGKYDEVRYCSTCDYEERITYSIAHGCEIDDEVKENIVSATCTKNGSYDLVTYCKTHTTQEISRVKEETLKLGHDYESEYTVDEAATCTSVGLKSKHCTRCDSKGDVFLINELDHIYKTTTTQASLSKNGEKVTKCTACDEVFKTVTIYKVSSVKLSYTKTTYNGKVKTPSVTVKDTKGNVLKKGTDYTVKYEDGRKSTGEYTVTIKFKGNYSGTKERTFKILPAATSKVTAASTKTTLKTTWKKVTGASGYKVQLLTSSGKVKSTKYTTNLNYKFTGLTKATTYKIKVTAYKTIDGDKICSLSSKTLKTATAPDKASLKVTAGTKKATLSWSKETCSGYEIVYDTNSKFSSSDKTVTISKSSTVKTTIKNLKKGKTYYFKIRAYKLVDGMKVYSENSNVVKVKIK